jgi:hypothetical protein
MDSTVNILQFDEIFSIPSTGYVYIILGGHDYKISSDNLKAALVDSNNKITLANKSASFLQSMPANIKIINIDAKWVSGTPTYCIGTTPGGNDISIGESVSSGISENSVLRSFLTSIPIYFTITGSGTLTFIIDILPNRFP